MKKRTVFIFVGPPGSGKGSLSRICVERLGWKQLSTGDLCRKHIQEKTTIGQEIDFAIKSGKLVSDSLITQMVCDWFESHSNETGTLILDGYPRTVKQAELFSECMADLEPSIKMVIVKFSIQDGTVIERLSSRFVCQNKECQAVYSLRPGSVFAPSKKGLCDLCSSPIGRRKDDNPQAVQERLRIYYKHEKDLLKFYEQNENKLHVLKSEQPIDTLFDRLQHKMGDMVA